MKRMKKMTAIMILAAVAALSTPQAFAGPGEITGKSKSGIMLGDRARGGIMLGDVVGLVLGSLTGLVLGSNS